MLRIFYLLLFFCFGFLSAQSVPLRVYKKENISIKSYNYRGIEPMLHQSNDTIYIINFWATWCAPCVKELPHFDEIKSNYKDKKVKVILVSLDFQKQVESSLIPFIKRKDVRSEVVHLNDPDADAWISKVDATWTGAIPATLIYNNRKRKFYEDSFTYESLDKALNEFLN